MRSLNSISEQAGIRTSSIRSIYLTSLGHPFLVATAVFVIILAGSCASILKSSVKKPRVKIVSLDISDRNDLTPYKLPLVVTLAVKNENRFPLHAQGITYAVLRTGKVIARGEKMDIPSIEPGEEARIAIPVEVSLDELVRTARAIFREKKVHLIVRGVASFGTPLGSLSIPFEKKFTKSLKDLYGVR